MPRIARRVPRLATRLPDFRRCLCQPVRERALLTVGSDFFTIDPLYLRDA